MIYLYLKTHNVTGLKYLGKTIRDPFTYKGSGKHWKRHIRKHGYDVTTEILFQTEDKEELKRIGLEYSEKWKVVESEEFANFIPEIGDGGSTVEGRILITNETGEKKFIDKNKNIPDGWKKGGSISPNKGKMLFSKEMKKQISVERKKYFSNINNRNFGELNGMYGKKWKKSSKEKANISRKETIENMSPEERSKKYSGGSGKKWYVFEDGSVLYVKDLSNPKFKNMKYQQGRKFKKERVK